MASHVRNGILMTAPQWLHWQGLSQSACCGAVGVMPELLGGLHITVTHNAGSLQGTGQCLLALTLPADPYPTDPFLVFLSSLLLPPASPFLTLLTAPSCPASRERALYFTMPMAGPCLTPTGHQHIATAPVLKQSWAFVNFVNKPCVAFVNFTFHRIFWIGREPQASSSPSLRSGLYRDQTQQPWCY